VQIFRKVFGINTTSKNIYDVQFDSLTLATLGACSLLKLISKPAISIRTKSAAHAGFCSLPANSLDETF